MTYGRCVSVVTEPLRLLMHGAMVARHLGTIIQV